MTTRRLFLLGAALAAPAIVRAESLMKIVVPKRVYHLDLVEELQRRVTEGYRNLAVEIEESWLVRGDGFVQTMMTAEGKVLFSSIEPSLPFARLAGAGMQAYFDPRADRVLTTSISVPDPEASSPQVNLAGAPCL